MFLVYFALWVILNGKWTTEIGVLGLVFATVIYLFTWKYMGFGPKVDMALFLRAPSAVRYGVTLLREIVTANIAVIKMIFSDKEVKPQLVRFDVDLKKNRHLVTLANSITLTPGTITVDLDGSRFTVHALDESLVDGLDDGVFVQQLIKMEEKHGMRQPKAEAPQEKQEHDEPAEFEAKGDAQAEESAATEQEPPEAIEAEIETEAEAEIEAEIEAETDDEAKEETGDEH